MKVQKLRELSDDELKGKCEECRKELFDLRMQAATGELDRPLRLKAARRDLAKGLTVMSERRTAKAGE